MSAVLASAWFWSLLTLVLAWLLVGLSLRYARWQGLVDQPGQRRSHTTPTPRGGGLGMLLAAMPGMVWALAVVDKGLGTIAVLAFFFAIALVMLVGWLDDHLHLHAAPRLLMHVLAAIIVSWVVLHDLQGWSGLPLALAAAGLVLAVAWSINAHNFMDGIDGLLGLQALFYFAALAAFAAWFGQAGIALACACLAMASLAFLFYNGPPARIFMGDVGSATVGLLVAAMAALLWRRVPLAVWPALILCSAFVIDASLTLLRRILSRRRWYNAHREHVYQWLVRCGLTHAQADALYLAWNLLIALPLACAAVHWPTYAFAMFVLAYVLAIVIHCAVRRACLQSIRARRRNAA